MRRPPHTKRLGRFSGGDLQVAAVAALRALLGGSRILILALFLLGIQVIALQAASFGRPIPNVATLRFDIGGVAEVMASNTVNLMVRSPATIEFLKYAPRPESGGEAVAVGATYYEAGGSFTLIPQPLATLNPTVPLLGSPSYYLGETIYLRLTDLDQNLDPAVAETVLVTITCVQTGDRETLRLIETGPDTGIFAGYLPTTPLASSIGADGVLVVTDNCQLQASYTDAFDLIQTVVDAALVDPFGIVFDSLSGEPIDGVSVTLIDVSTNAPATVYGDDAVSLYPATVVTASGVTDAGGQFYQLPPGGFRFPYIAPGTYRLDLVVPEGYTFPTTVADDLLLQVRPDAALVLGSRNQPFPVDPGPALRIDLPLDPLRNYLLLQKFVSEEQVSVGDFLQYRLELQNTSAGIAAPAVQLSDRLPPGFRYQKGSTRIAGVGAADPLISADGRSLTFELGDLPAKGKLEITYVVEIAAGARSGDAINTARATDGNGAVSNLAKRSVRVQEAFFRNQAFLVGQVLSGSCNQDDRAMKGVPGVRLYLEDGSYVLTDKDGKYHFEGVEPGLHVVQVDLLTLPAGYQMIPCEESSQFAGRSFSQFVDLKGGTLWRVNFYAAPLPPATGEVNLQLFSTLTGDLASLRVVAQASAVPVDNLRLTVMLPGAAGYLPGSARQGGEPIADPQILGGSVNLRTPRLEAGQTLEFTFQARLADIQTDGELPAKALLTFDTPAAKNQRTPLAENLFRLTPGEQRPSQEIRLHPRFPTFIAELQQSDGAMLEQLVARLKDQRVVRIDVVGHTDNQRISRRSRHVFADNQALSEGRAGSIAEFLRQRLKLPAASITQRGMGESLPIADNATEEGRALNRRVEVFVVTEAVATPGRAEVTKGASELQRAATTGASPADVKIIPRKLTAPPAAKAPELTPGWLAAVKPEAGILWPQQGHTPDIPSTTVLVQHPNGSQIELLVNGKPVPRLNFDSSKPVPSSNFQISQWVGVDLGNGLNRIEARITGSSGESLGQLERSLWYVTKAEKIQWLQEKSNLLADGIHPPTFALRLTDRDGHPLRPGLLIDYRVSRPYQALRNVATEEINPAAEGGKLEVGADGLAYAQLEPTTLAGEVTLSLLVPGEPLQVRTWLKPAPREWILAGFAQGTVGYNTLTDKLVSAKEAGIEEHGYTDGQVKFFAKGAVKGEWLLTLAYDSDKPDFDGDSLHQAIDPDRYYPLYGDETRQGYEAASAHDLYVKLEREQFYALFGDMQTGLTKTVLSQYSRSMSGFKSEMEGEHFGYTLFAADTRQSFVKDELRGDGTSGRYPLSQRDLVINSEEVVIQTRDRFHNERIIKEERLTRHLDYDIDYDTGTLFFKRPVSSKDRDFNPMFIIVRYETASTAQTNLNYGGRAAVKLLQQRVEVGGSLVHEQNGVAEGDLHGADLTVKLTSKTTLRAEVASTEVETLVEAAKADAYLAQIEHRDERIDARAWLRQQDPKFGLGQQNNGTSGMRSYGAEGSYRLTQKWSLAGEAWREDNLETDAKRNVESLLTRYQAERYGLSAGLREARDSFETGETQRSQQVLFGSDWSTPNRKLTLRATHEQSIGDRNDNVDFPTRTLLGADYALTQSVSVFAEQEFTWGEQQDTAGTRAGLRATPWQGGEVRSSVGQQIDENGQRVFALYGVGQSWQVSPHWSVDGNLDRSNTLSHKSVGERVNEGVPLSSGGDEDFTAVSLGAGYKVEKWSWWNRLETRQGDLEEKYGVSSGLVGEVRAGVVASARLLAFIANSSDGRKREEEKITLGLAYRPQQSRWIILDRLDLSLFNEETASTDKAGKRIVNHLHGNYRFNRKVQFSVYYGLKYVRTTFDGARYAGYSDMLALETRYNLTKKWDIGLHGSLLHSWNSGQFNYGLGGDLGYLVMTNAWVSLGYNLYGFEDKDFSAANYTSQGPYLRFRLKFDQETVRGLATGINSL